MRKVPPLHLRQFTIESDHRPLEMIVMKRITSAPGRLQHLLLRFKTYQVKVYIPGKELILTDVFLRYTTHTTTSIQAKVNLIEFGTRTATLLQYNYFYDMPRYYHTHTGLEYRLGYKLIICERINNFGVSQLSLL